MPLDESGNPEVVIGEPGGDRVAIRLMGRMHPGADDFWDGNWLISPVEVTAGDFHGTVAAGLRSEELRQLREGLERLHADMAGEAALESMEGWLSLSVAVRSRGRLEIRGRAVDRPGDGNQLAFAIADLDLSHLPPVIEALAGAEAAFPVVGTP